MQIGWHRNYFSLFRLSFLISRKGKTLLSSETLKQPSQDLSHVSQLTLISQNAFFSFFTFSSKPSHHCRDFHSKQKPELVGFFDLGSSWRSKHLEKNRWEGLVEKFSDEIRRKRDRAQWQPTSKLLTTTTPTPMKIGRRPVAADGRRRRKTS